MKIYQIGKSIIVEDVKSVKNITELRPSIASSLELIKVAINNDLSVSEYLTKIMNTKQGDFSKEGLINPRIPIDSPEALTVTGNISASGFVSASKLVRIIGL